MWPQFETFGLCWIFFCHLQTGSEAHLATYPMSTGSYFLGGMQLTTHSHLMPRLKMHGAIPPLPSTYLGHAA